MRIAVVGLTFPFRGGISHYTTLLFSELAKKHEAKFFALSRQYPEFLFPGKTQKDYSRERFQVPYEACLDSINPLTWFFAYRKIKAFKPDMILFSWWNPFFAPSFGTVAYLAKLFSGIPGCYLCHNVIPHEHTLLDRILLKYAFGSGKAFITHSKEDHDNLKKLRPGAPVFQNPHPTYEIFASKSTVSDAEAKTQLGVSDKKVLLFFGYIREYKGLIFLLQAMEKLTPGEEYHLLIVGEFYDDRNNYEPLLKNLTEKNQLTLVDRYVPNEEVPMYFQAADLVIAPYTTATQSGIVQIAYGFHKPVIATNVGGLPETVVEGETGFLVNPADADAIAEKIMYYFQLDNKDKFKLNITRELDKYSWDHMIATIETICHQLNS